MSLLSLRAITSGLPGDVEGLLLSELSVIAGVGAGSSLEKGFVGVSQLLAPGGVNKASKLVSMALLPLVCGNKVSRLFSVMATAFSRVLKLRKSRSSMVHLVGNGSESALIGVKLDKRACVVEVNSRLSLGRCSVLEAEMNESGVESTARGADARKALLQVLTRCIFDADHERR